MAVSQLYEHWLDEEGHNCKFYQTGKDFIKALGRESFDLAILDWELPDLSGAEVLLQMRKQLDWPMPVLFATNRDEESDIVYALRAGADDYMVKPVKRNEMLARLTALGRRFGNLETDQTRVNTEPYKMDSVELQVNFDNESIQLTRKEFDLALFLFRNPGRLLSRGHIMESVWGQNAELNTRTVDTHVSAIRQKMKIAPERGWRLVSIYGYGYRLEQVNQA